MWIRTGTMLLLCLAPAAGRADEPCPGAGDAWALARCAAARGEAVRRARHELEAAQGRQRTAQHLLPANPTLDLMVGRRRTEAGATDVDRGVELSQAFEVGGQRGARVALAEGEVRAAAARLEAARRQVTIDVLAAAVEVWRARLAGRFASEQRALAQRLVEVSTARVREGVGPALDLELAEAARVQAHREELASARLVREAGARLALLVGGAVELADGAITVAAPDRPRAELVREAQQRRSLVQQARAELEAGQRRLDLLERERIPSVTLGASYRHEEFSDVGALRLSVPLPLFRRNQGAILEQQAQNAGAGVAEEQARLKVALEVEEAHEAWTRARALAALVGPDLERRLAADAESLRDAYQRGTMPLPAALAGLREVFGARRTVADARAEVTLATLDLLTAIGGSPQPEAGP